MLMLWESLAEAVCLVRGYVEKHWPFDQPGVETEKRERRNYQEMTLVIMYHRPTRPAATNTNMPRFSQK